VPFHTAFGVTLEESDRMRLDRVERLAMTIIFSEFEGNIFDWRNMRWKDHKQ
jgi:hypothetical protein